MKRTLPIITLALLVVGDGNDPSPIWDGITADTEDEDAESDYVPPDTHFEAIDAWGSDLDGDGYSPAEGDCDDSLAGIKFDLPLDQPLDLDFDLPINQETVVVLTQAVPLSNVSARFNLPGGGGQINGSVSLSLPAGMQLPIRLEMAVPVETTIPVQMTVPVSQSVQVEMEIPVEIQLGDSGLDPAVQELREVFVPLRTGLERMPDRIQFW